jgi:hypothetical protein
MDPLAEWILRPKCEKTRKLFVNARIANIKHPLQRARLCTKSHTPLLTWFWMSYLVAHDKHGVSAAFIACELELTYLDDAFFGAPSEGDKCRRGTEQTPVLVGVSLKKQGALQFVKM